MKKPQSQTLANSRRSAAPASGRNLGAPAARPTQTTHAPTSTPRVALVHDYLREYGGAERVVEALHQLFPDAPLYTAFVDQQAMGIHWAKFAEWDIRESWITKIPGYRAVYSPLRIWADRYFSAFDLSGYDLVISSSNAYLAKAVEVPNGVHICYCHTPPRALYGYATMSNWKKNPLTRIVGTLINHYLRVVDYHIAQKVDYFIANSQETARRIKKFYRRESEVIWPPVAVQPASADQLIPLVQREYYLYVNRLALAKHPDLAVQAATALNLPLKVVGVGPMLKQLREQAGPTVEFLGAVDDAALHTLYAGAKALLYPVEDEDFGIVPVEAMSYGLPVIAHRSGGPMETVVDGTTGILFDELTATGLQLAIQDAQAQDFSEKKIAQHAQSFSQAAFLKRLQQYIELIDPNLAKLTQK